MAEHGGLRIGELPPHDPFPMVGHQPDPRTIVVSAAVLGDPRENGVATLSALNAAIGAAVARERARGNWPVMADMTITASLRFHAPLDQGKTERGDAEEIVGTEQPFSFTPEVAELIQGAIEATDGTPGTARLRKALEAFGVR